MNREKPPSEDKPEEDVEKMILEMQGEKGVKKVRSQKDREREKKEARAGFGAARRKIFGETEEGQQEFFRE